jgi:hypothetical protein
MYLPIKSKSLISNLKSKSQQSVINQSIVHRSAALCTSYSLALCTRVLQRTPTPRTTMMRASRVVRIGISLTLLTCLFTGIAGPQRSLFLSERNQPLEPRPYSTKDIALTAPYLHSFHPLVLVFNGTNFEVYNLNHKDTHYSKTWHCGRCGQIIPLMVHALRATNPGRFEPGQPVFQLLFSAADSIASDCVNAGTCPVEDFAPISLFGSAPTNERDIPTIKAFPNWFYLKCIYEYKLQGKEHCKWVEPIDESPLPWDALEPTIIWRGSDFVFLLEHKEFKFKGAGRIDLTNVTTKKDATQKLMDSWSELRPRWRGVALTAKAELDGDHWIDTKFFGPFGLEEQKKFLDHDVHVSTEKRLSPTEMARYKYQIDYGGGGGKSTNWDMCLLLESRI